MPKIKLTNGMETIVDDDDYEKFGQYQWRFAPNNSKYNTSIGYAVRGHKTILLHREIMKTPQGMFTDHINGDKLDNRKSNLRIVNRHQNATNTPKRSATLSSVYKGVTKENNQNVYRVSVKVGNRIVKINGFQHERHAALAYDLWAIDLFGNYANTNFTGVKCIAI